MPYFQQITIEDDSWKIVKLSRKNADNDLERETRSYLAHFDRLSS